jgi:hypothetical protein
MFRFPSLSKCSKTPSLLVVARCETFPVLQLQMQNCKEGQQFCPFCKTPERVECAFQSIDKLERSLELFMVNLQEAQILRDMVQAVDLVVVVRGCLQKSSLKTKGSAVNNSGF